jgi:DNA polymerase III subunit epsilon
MINPKETPLNFLDIETTGTNYNKDKIIEIYISKVINGKEIDSYHTLINPGFRPSDFILNLTSIQVEELKSSPDFEDVAEDIYDFIRDGVIVAHNARFDYSFIKTSLRSFGFDINLDYCCSVKLSRILYPRYRKHGLDSLIERLGYPDGERHRARYDTDVIREFFRHSEEEHGSEKFAKAFNSSIKKSAIPEALLKLKPESLPESPGVYIFYGNDQFPLYVGMSKNIRRRVYEHFYQDLSYIKDLNINKQLKRIETIPTAGVVGAYIREAILIKKYQPLYNRMLRRNRELIKLEKSFNNKGYAITKFNNDNDFRVGNMNNIVGIFRNKMDLKNKLNSFVKTHGLCPKLLGLEKLGGACFSYQLGQCKGACIGKVSAEEYNNIFDKALSSMKIEEWPYDKAVQITEDNGDAKETLTFDKWCLVNSSDEELTQEVENFTFDLDIYKILKRHLSLNLS